MSWRMHKEIAGSGAHGDLNAHIVDLARYLTGDEIHQVVGDMKTFISERPEADGSGTGPSHGRRRDHLPGPILRRGHGDF